MFANEKNQNLENSIPSNNTSNENDKKRCEWSYKSSKENSTRT